MCGINGFNFSDRTLLELMLKKTNHRGPDDTGVFVNDSVSFGHNRLSIIDPSSAGHQPMKSADGNFIITYNGELYNYKELKKELLGYNFKTQTDTEVILAAYMKWGNTCVKKFNGMFAFAIWDERKKLLFLARDQFGIKPLYYYFDGKRFIFSSEIKGIQCHALNLELDNTAINIYFRLLYIPEPYTPWKNVYKLPAAHFALIKNGKLLVEQYWKIKQFDTITDRSEAKKMVQSVFKKSVERQLISDKPLGLYLSGGIDSTALLGVMSKIRQQPIQTFSVGFAVNEQKEKYNADFDIAKKTSAYFKSNHHEVVISARDVRDNFETIVSHADDLVANHTQSAMFTLASFAKKSVDVVLTGDGGDEIFAGYERYYLNALLNNVQSIPRFIRKNKFAYFALSFFGKRELYNKLIMENPLDRYEAFMFQKEAMISQFLNPLFSQAVSTHAYLANRFSPSSTMIVPADSTKFLMYADMVGWLRDDALNRGDRMSMAHGLEARVPFLDIDLVTLAMNIPAEYNVDTRLRGKKLFKEALHEYIPGFVYNEPKRGWFSPVAKWLRSDLEDWAREIFSESYNPDAVQYIDFNAVRRILDGHISGKQYALNTIWSILTFQVWLYKQTH